MRAKTLMPLVALACLLAVPARALVNYTISGTTAYVSSSPSASGNIVVASTYNGYPVTMLGEHAFYGSFVTSVTIPDSVITIGDGAFEGCSSLTNVTIGNSVTNLGSRVFSYCRRLTSVSIPANLTNIGSYAFYQCGLTNFSVDAANLVYSSHNGVLFNKAQTTLIAFPPGRGGNYVIPSSVTNIGSYAFFWCDSLQGVTIPNNVANIESHAFSRCFSLTNATMGSGVITIGDAAFYGCTGLTSVTIGNSVFRIGNSAFSACSNLTDVTISSSVTNIGSYAFSECTSLKEVAIPDSVTTIGSYPFHYCLWLTKLTFLGHAPLLASNDAFQYVEPGARVYYYYGTIGWGPSYGGLPTVMLGAPAPQFDAGTAGVKPGGFGFTIRGVVNQSIVVDASTNLATWQPVWTNPLSAVSTNFVDPQWLNHPRRFYRMRSN